MFLWNSQFSPLISEPYLAYSSQPLSHPPILRNHHQNGGSYSSSAPATIHRQQEDLSTMASNEGAVSTKPASSAAHAGGADDSSESEGETEPAKSFHRRFSTNKNIKSSASLSFPFFYHHLPAERCPRCLQLPSSILPKVYKPSKLQIS